MSGMLQGLRILDLSDEKGLLCGRLLADMGADVIAIEPPGGNTARRLGPFYHDIPDVEKSLQWFAFSSNKRGITLDIRQEQGKRILFKMLEKCDILIETFSPTYLDNLDCGYKRLSEIKPDLIMVSITPFGQYGPYRDYAYSDPVIMGLGGHPYLSGAPEREPLHVNIPQSPALSGFHGAMSALIALWHREMTGEGQQIDISMQECATWISFNSLNFWDLNRIRLKRQGMWRSFGQNNIRVVFQCKDGYVTLWLLGGAWGAEGQNRLKEWAHSEGKADDFWLNFDYEHWDAACSTQDICNQMAQSLSNFFITKTKDELFKAAVTMGFFLAPVSSTIDLLENEQLKHRGFWVQVEYPELKDSLTHPGAFVKILEGLPLNIWRRAPFIGEHNLEIYSNELGFSESDLVLLKSQGVI